MKPFLFLLFVWLLYSFPSYGQSKFDLNSDGNVSMGDVTILIDEILHPGSHQDSDNSECTISVKCLDMRNGDNVSAESLKFPFVVSDILGVFPESGDQMSFSLSSGAGSTSATISSGSWNLKTGTKYYGYLPFNRANYLSESLRNKLPITYLNQEQSKPNNTIELGNYLYYTSGGTTIGNNNLSLVLRHLGTLAKITIPIPSASVFSKLYLVANSDVFVTEGTVDLTSNSTSITPTKRSDRIELKLNNQKYAESVVGSLYTFYLMFPPCNCNDQNLKIVLVDSYGNKYTASTRNSMNNNFSPGYYYEFKPAETFTKTSGSSSDGGGNIGFIIESDEMGQEDIYINF